MPASPRGEQAGERATGQQCSREAKTERFTPTGDPELDALLAIEAKEETHLAGMGHSDRAVAEELEHNKNTDWLRGCGWP